MFLRGEAILTVYKKKFLLSLNQITIPLAPNNNIESTDETLCEDRMTFSSDCDSCKISLNNLRSKLFKLLDNE